MRKIEEVRELTDPEELVKEWDERRKLASKMVGKLYPSILADEVVEIELRFGKIADEKGLSRSEKRAIIRKVIGGEMNE